MTKITKEQIDLQVKVLEEAIRKIDPSLFKAFIFKDFDEETPAPSGIEKMVCEDITRRQQEGIKKYGTTVGENPLTTKQWQQHLYEELLDAAIYQKKLIESDDSFGLDQRSKAWESIVDTVMEIEPNIFNMYLESTGEEAICSWIRDNCKQNKKEDDGWILNTGEPPFEFLGGLFDLVLRNGTTTRALEWDYIRWGLEDNAYDVMKYRKSKGNG